MGSGSSVECNESLKTRLRKAILLRAYNVRKGKAEMTLQEQFSKYAYRDPLSMTSSPSRSNKGARLLIKLEDVRNELGLKSDLNGSGNGAILGGGNMVADLFYIIAGDKSADIEEVDFRLFIDFLESGKLPPRNPQHQVLMTSASAPSLTNAPASTSIETSSHSRPPLPLTQGLSGKIYKSVRSAGMTDHTIGLQSLSANNTPRQLRPFSVRDNSSSSDNSPQTSSPPLSGSVSETNSCGFDERCIAITPAPNMISGRQIDIGSSMLIKSTGLALALNSKENKSRPRAVHYGERLRLFVKKGQYPIQLLTMMAPCKS